MRRIRDAVVFLALSFSLAAVAAGAPADVPGADAKATAPAPAVVPKPADATGAAPATGPASNPAPSPASDSAPSPTSAPAPATDTGATAAAKSAASTQVQALDARIQDLKGDVLTLNRDLLVLEEELLFPASTQVAVFVSLDVGKLFALDSVQVRLDDKEVANYLYTPAEVLALQRGGVQRLYLGNLRSGPHQIVAFFTGKGPHDRDYKRGATVQFDKSADPKYIELRIRDSSGRIQPEFDVRVWQ